MPSGTPFDACTRGSVEFKIGDVTATSNALMCGVKVSYKSSPVVLSVLLLRY